MTPKMESLSSESGEDSSSGSTSSRRTTKNNDDYLKRRERNNQAVKKSREKTRMKTKQMVDRVSELRNENEELERNIETLTKEVRILKDLFLGHAGSAHGIQMNEDELSKMLCEDPEVNEGVNLLLSISQGSPPRHAAYRVHN